MEKNTAREGFKSRLGFLLVSAGCAIGIGNVWRFPYVTGQNGGGVFVLLYLVFLLVLGVPVLTMEFAVGRASRKSALEGYRALEKPGHKWHLHGWVAMAGCWLLMMYYTTVSGWMVDYFVKFLTGAFQPGMTREAVDGVFTAMQGNPAEMAGFMALIVVAGFAVNSFGLQKGLERISKWMMLALLALIVVLAVHALTLPGGGEGVAFYLLPSMTRVKEAGGLGKVIVAAMNQAFFTLSIGASSMEIFGSYMTKDHTLAGESVRICALDTFVAMMSGLIIFPACFAFGVEPDAGPSLIFKTLPNVFVSMPGGRIWGALFFLFMTFASFSTVIAVFQNLLAFAADTFGWSRRRAVLIGCAAMLLTSLPSLLGYNLLSGVKLIGGRNILDTEDFIVSSLLLPLGSLVYLLFCVSRWGWGFDNYLAEANTGRGPKLPRQLKPVFQFVLPVLLLVVLVSGLLPQG